MHFEIAHFTEYRYSAPVLLMPQTLRLRPREDGTQRLHVFRLDVQPVPSRVSMQAEPDGNTSLLATFSAAASFLRIHAYSKVETHRVNPFDFVITELAAMQVPVTYEPRLAHALSPALTPIDAPAVYAFAQACARDAGNDTLQFLSLLNRRLWERMRVVLRLSGEPMAPDECLQCGEGACRDLAMVFVAAARHLGLAARFVSGYQMTDPNEHARYLHAWAEVYLPGGGWRGYDPTHGIAVDDRYVPVAASSYSSLAAPIDGRFTPAHVTSQMKVTLDLRSSCPVPAQTAADTAILSKEPTEAGSAFAAVRPSLPQSRGGQV
jgi:transglutaminase-like putative cysteine protease